MKIFKKTFIILLISIVLLLVIGSVYAENSTDMNNDTCVVASIKSYTDFNEQISNSKDGDVLKINSTYKFDKNNDANFTDGVNLNKSITLIGQNNASIDGSKLARCLFIDSNCNVVLENLIFRNGYSESSGAGIFLSTNSQLTIKNCIFEFNKVYNSDGGAIDGEEGTSIEIHNSKFFNNTSKRVSDLDWEDYKKGMGSAICTRIGSILQIYDSVFKGNNGYLTTILVISYDDVVKKVSKLYIQNCLFESNSATSSGVIYLDEFGIGEIHDSIFRNNTVRKRSGMVLLDASEYALVKNCTFEGNHAIKGGAIYVKVFEEKYGLMYILKTVTFIIIMHPLMVERYMQNQV